MFEHYIYQPFFNILVWLYWFLGTINPDLADMGVAVIVFSIVVQIILFPLRLAGERSEDEKKAIVDKFDALNVQYAHEPIKQREEIKKLMRGNARTVVSTTINLLIQIGLVLMLYRIFTTGLEGADFYLLYPFVPRVDHINLMFLGKYDLSHTNATLNLLQSAMIFLVEMLGAIRTTSIIRKKDIALMQLILPLGSYIIFMFLPSGKKLFVITALAFSAVYNVIKIIQETFEKLMAKMSPSTPAASEHPVTEHATSEHAAHATSGQTITLTDTQIQALTQPPQIVNSHTPEDAHSTH